MSRQLSDLTQCYKVILLNNYITMTRLLLLVIRLNKWCGSVLLSDDWDVFGEQEEEYINKGCNNFLPPNSLTARPYGHSLYNSQK